MNKPKLHTAILIVAALTLFTLAVGCGPSEDPPIHLNPNMDNQEKYKAQSSSNFFADGSSMRQPVEGTVAWGELREDQAYFKGIDTLGDTLRKSPVPTTMSLLKRGQERYNIYCAPCHGRTGYGRGIVVERGMLPATSFHDDSIRVAKDGHIFNVISNGLRNMPSYRHQIAVADRWAIIAYVRALQRSQNATAADVPKGE